VNQKKKRSEQGGGYLEGWAVGLNSGRTATSQKSSITVSSNNPIRGEPSKCKILVESRQEAQGLEGEKGWGGERRRCRPDKEKVIRECKTGEKKRNKRTAHKPRRGGAR